MAVFRPAGPLSECRVIRAEQDMIRLATPRNSPSPHVNALWRPAEVASAPPAQVTAWRVPLPLGQFREFYKACGNATAFLELLSELRSFVGGVVTYTPANTVNINVSDDFLEVREVYVCH